MRSRKPPTAWEDEAKKAWFSSGIIGGADGGCFCKEAEEETSILKICTIKQVSDI